MVGWIEQAWSPLVTLGLGLVLGWLWGQVKPPAPPRENPWAVRRVRELDGGEHWTI
jgi:hypothetical protein